MFKWLRELFGLNPSPSKVEASPRRPSAPKPSAPREAPEAAEPLSSLEEVVAPTYEPSDHRREVPPGELQSVCQQITEHFKRGEVELPAFPTVAAEVFGIIEHPDFDVGELIRVIQRDPVVSTELLRLANSSRYAAGAEIESSRDALVRLGAKETARAVSAASARALFDMEARATHEELKPFWDHVWQHATVTSFASAWFTMTFRKGNHDRVFLGGLLHDVGKSLALRSLGSLVVSQTLKGVTPALVHAAIEATHLPLGVEAAKAWKLPAGIVAVIEEHHLPVPRAEAVDVHVVRVVSGLHQYRSNPYHRRGLLDEVLLSAQMLGLTLPQLRMVVSEIGELAEKSFAIAK